MNEQTVPETTVSIETTKPSWLTRKNIAIVVTATAVAAAALYFRVRRPSSEDSVEYETPETPAV